MRSIQLCFCAAPNNFQSSAYNTSAVCNDYVCPNQLNNLMPII